MEKKMETTIVYYCWIRGSGCVSSSIVVHNVTLCEEQRRQDAGVFGHRRLFHWGLRQGSSIPVRAPQKLTNPSALSLESLKLKKTVG